MAFIFDTSTLIEAKNRYYAFDVCPAFWDWLLLEKQRGNVVCIEAVKVELKDPDAQKWVKANPGFFDPNDLSRMRDVSQWVNNHEQYLTAAKMRFLDGVDPIVISHALANGHVVVTQEVPAPNSKKAIKIPDVCAAFGANCKNSFEVLSELKARFILAV